MGSAPLIRLEGVRVKRGGFALEIPKWEVPPGCVVGVVGPNGAGKTTLLNLLPGLSRPELGSVSVMGMDPRREQTAVRSQLGFMSDDMALFELRTDKLLRMLSGYYPTWDAALVEALVERLEIDLTKRVSQLSKGQGTRLRLLCAMAFRPRLLVLDEPATGLDVSGRRALLEVVLDVVRDPQRSVIISSHQLGDVERIADRLLVLERGEVIRDGYTNDLVGDERTLEEALLAWGAA